MATIRASWANVEGTGALFLAGKVTGASGALTNLSGPLAHQSVISCTRTGAGTYSITLNPFKAPLGAVNVGLTPVTADRACSISAGPTYTGDSLALTVKTRSITGAPADTDADFYFEFQAF